MLKHYIDKSKCLSTRYARNGLRVRRYRTTDGVIFNTVELPAEVSGSFSAAGKMDKRLGGWARAMSTKSTRAVAMAMLAQGTKAAAVAHELGLNDSTVMKYRRRASDGK